MMRISQLLLILLLLLSNEVRATTFAYIPRSPDQLISRVKYKKQIQHQFEKDSVVLLYGLPGIGKTALATLYAQEQAQEYHLIYWIDCRHNIVQQLKEMLGLLRQKLHIPFDFRRLSLKNSLALLYDLFSKKNQKMLLIFDNCNDYNTSRLYLSGAK